MKRCLLVPFLACALASASEVHAAQYYTNYSAVGGEINGSTGGLNARSLVAAGRMDLKFWSNTSISETSLLSLCQARSAAGTTWKEGCDFGGMIGALSATSGGWVKGVSTVQNDGLNNIISGLMYHQSPAMVPLYGHATHWGTIYMVDTDGSTIYGLEYYDSGPVGQQDGQYTYYQNGVQGCDGETFKNTFYKVINSSYLSASDPYLGKYLSTFEPPATISGPNAEKAWQKMGPPIMWRAPGVLERGERMTPEVAQAVVWDALLAANVPASKHLWPAIEQGWADLGREVHGVTPAGAPWNYFVVPIRAEDGSTLGLVQLSADDGAYQQMWAGLDPIEFTAIEPAEAFAIAQAQVDDSTTLYGGGLSWGADVETPLVPSPLFPYYEFHAVDKRGEYAGRILVTLRDGEIVPLDQPGQTVRGE